MVGREIRPQGVLGLAGPFLLLMKYTGELSGLVAALDTPKERNQEKMDRRSFLGIAGAAPLLLLGTSCTPDQITEILNIAEGVLTAGEGLIPVLQGSGVITPIQGSQVATYVNGAATLTGVILAGLQGAVVDAQFKSRALAVQAKSSAIGPLPAPVSTKVQQIGTGLQKALAIDTPTMPHVSMATNPVAYLKIGRLHRRALKLAAHAAQFA